MDPAVLVTDKAPVLVRFPKTTGAALAEIVVVPPTLKLALAPWLNPLATVKLPVVVSEPPV
jgi:hypothetical protein